jgi:transcriptional regulator with XRE-family HTH domain
MAGKRHSPQDIAAKLQQADDMAVKGKTQREISRALGISIMTYHRWRKQAPSPPSTEPMAPEVVQRPAETAGGDRLTELRLENSRLRRLVTDLLLEKMTLEDQLRDQEEAKRRRRC